LIKFYDNSLPATSEIFLIAFKQTKNQQNKGYMPVPVWDKTKKGRVSSGSERKELVFFGERFLSCLLHPHHKGTGHS